MLLLWAVFFLYVLIYTVVFVADMCYNASCSLQFG